MVSFLLDSIFQFTFSGEFHCGYAITTRFQCEDRLSGHKDSNYNDKTVVRPSYLYDGRPYAGKTASFILMSLVSGLRRTQYIDGLAQERCNSIANVLELHLSCTNPSISL